MCTSHDRTTCATHGGTLQLGVCPSRAVAYEVLEERHRQFTRYGTNNSLEDGTGPLERWLVPVSGMTADMLEKEIRSGYEHHEDVHGAPSWRHLLLEEVAEAFQEEDPVRLREELMQVAALAVSWIETLDHRTAEMEKTA